MSAESSKDNKVEAYVAWKPHTQLEKWSYTPKPLGDDDIEIKITHNGVCHSDIHMRDNDWDATHYPLVPGHEIVGIVSKTGTKVVNLKYGDRVGVGWIKNSCQYCQHCIEGHENFCSNQLIETIVGKDNFGGYAQSIRVNRHFAYKIPNGLASEHAAPLLCAGVTVYSPLRKHLTKPGMRVGIVSIGGLGHIAIKMAKAMGAHVTALSSSKNKENECLNVHKADTFMIWSKDELKKHIICDNNNECKFDLLLCCGSVELDWKLALRTIKKNGVLSIVGAPNCDINVPLLSLQENSQTICSSNVGGSAYMLEMLQFCAINEIEPMVELMPLSKVNQAMEKVENNQARYRVVLVSDFEDECSPIVSKL